MTLSSLDWLDVEETEEVVDNNTMKGVAKSSAAGPERGRKLKLKKEVGVSSEEEELIDNESDDSRVKLKAETDKHTVSTLSSTSSSRLKKSSAEVTSV